MDIDWALLFVATSVFHLTPLQPTDSSSVFFRVLNVHVTKFKL